MRARLVFALISSASAVGCSALLGLDFEPRHAEGDASDAAPDAPVVESGAGEAAASVTEAGSEPPVPPAFDRAWSRWKVSSPFPGDETSARDGIVSDDVTALVWAQDPLPDILPWAEAAAACNGLRLGGFSDWRVPTRIELLSLIAYEYSPPTVADLGMPLAETWTSSPFAGDPTRAWAVAFNQGSVLDRPRSDALRVRCVRRGQVISNAPPLRFESRSGVVRDKVTGLAWQAAPTKNGSFAEAKAYCEGLVLDGEVGFRVPAVHELHSIVDEKRKNPALDPMFASLGLTWSSTIRPNVINETLAWTMDEVDGHILSRNTTELANVRCVK